MTLLPQRGYAYLRVSTSRQDLSLEAQTETIQRAAQYHLGRDCDDTYSESDTSGSIPFAERPEAARLLQQLRSDLAQGFSPTVIVTKVDRLGRDTVDVSQTATLFDQMGVRLVLLDLNVDTRTPMGRGFMQIAAVFAEMERARIRERIQTTLDLKRSQNLVIGTVPYGWDAHPTGQSNKAGKPILELVPNLEEQKWILWMARARAGKRSWTSIASELNRRGVPTKRRGEKLNKRQVGGGCAIGRAIGLWNPGTVTGVLTNKTTQAFLAAHEP